MFVLVSTAQFDHQVGHFTHDEIHATSFAIKGKDVHEA